MLVVHKHKKNINLSRDMNYRSLLFLMLLLWAWQIKKWPNPKIKGLMWKKILIIYCLHKTGNLLCEKHGQKANSKFFECPRVLGSPHPWMTISQGLIFFFINILKYCKCKNHYRINAAKPIRFHFTTTYAVWYSILGHQLPDKKLHSFCGSTRRKL